MSFDDRPAPRLMTIPEVAERLHKSTRWMQDFLRQNPFGRMAGRTRLFTEADIAAIIEALPCPSSSSSATAPQTGTCVAPSEASLWTKAQRLGTTSKPKRPGRSRGAPLVVIETEQLPLRRRLS